MKKLMKKLTALSTFASQGPVAIAAIANKMNGLDLIAIEYTLTSALVSTETVDLVLPNDYRTDYTPFAVAAYTEAAPSVLQTTLAITNHNQTNGTTRLTASGNVANGSKITVVYARAS